METVGKQFHFYGTTYPMPKIKRIRRPTGAVSSWTWRHRKEVQRKCDAGRRRLSVGTAIGALSLPASFLRFFSLSLSLFLHRTLFFPTYLSSCLRFLAPTTPSFHFFLLIFLGSFFRTVRISVRWRRQTGPQEQQPASVGHPVSRFLPHLDASISRPMSPLFLISSPFNLDFK